MPISRKRRSPLVRHTVSLLFVSLLAGVVCAALAGLLLGAGLEPFRSLGYAGPLGMATVALACVPAVGGALSWRVRSRVIAGSPLPLWVPVLYTVTALAWTFSVGSAAPIAWVMVAAGALAGWVGVRHDRVVSDGGRSRRWALAHAGAVVLVVGPFLYFAAVYAAFGDFPDVSWLVTALLSALATRLWLQRGGASSAPSAPAA